MRRLRLFALPVLLGLLFCVASLHLAAAPVAADSPVTPTVDQYCVNGSYPTAYGCTSGYIPYAYGGYRYYGYYSGYRYPYTSYPYRSYYYPYTYYPSYYYSYAYPYRYFPSRSWIWCTIPGDGGRWVPLGASTAGMICN